MRMGYKVGLINSLVISFVWTLKPWIAQPVAHPWATVQGVLLRPGLLYAFHGLGRAVVLSP